MEVEAVNTAETTETDPVPLVATVTCQGGAERDTCAITVVPDQPAGLRITPEGDQELEPVSYTHLDVYKRQASGGCRWGSEAGRPQHPGGICH